VPLAGALDAGGDGGPDGTHAAGRRSDQDVLHRHLRLDMAE